MSRPTVSTAERLGKLHRVSRVIVVWVDDEAGEMGYASWGKDRATCEDTRRLADELYAVTCGYFGAVEAYD